MIPLARLVRQRGASVVILGSDLTAIQLVELSSVFISYRQLLRELDRTGALEAPTGHAPVRERRVVRERTRPSSEPLGPRSAPPVSRSRGRAEPAAMPAVAPTPSEDPVAAVAEDDAGVAVDGATGRRRRRRGGRGRGRSQTMGAGIDEQAESVEADAIEQLVTGYFESKDAEVAAEPAAEPVAEIEVEAPAPSPRRRGRRVVGAREPEAADAGASEPVATTEPASEPEPPVRRRSTLSGPPVFRAFGEEPPAPQSAAVADPEPEPAAPPARRSRRKVDAVAELVVASAPEESSANGVGADPPKRRRSSRAKPAEAGAAS